MTCDSRDHRSLAASRAGNSAPWYSSGTLGVHLWIERRPGPILAPAALARGLQPSPTLANVPPPSITAQPADQSVTAGQPASFSVTASGTGPLTYQWQRDAVAISGATNAGYALSSTAVGDSGAKFTVTVSNSAGSATSNAATLTVAAAGHLVNAAAGGNASSDDGKVTITSPPNALTADATVIISAPGPDWTVPASLPRTIHRRTRHDANDFDAGRSLRSHRPL